uniref:Uncharacterized protein isoform X2 n=1 Tax=Nicotiana tabacum TaxID=4097 RepID=A0A1S4CDY3_TOBAC|nr:uncharacterized protein LOC104104278 isoform X2 [Nicotiana tomentosiformis]XP_016499427.1 PREDICTED: uncharacterized protein LOC107818030 isoform X2 [Nicotiana tabacum]
MVEIEEASTDADEVTPLLSNPKPDPNHSTRTKSVRTEVPEVKVHLYRQGKGPIDEFTMPLGGWDQDQLEVREILDKYGFKSVYAFKPDTGRGVPIRFNPRNGRSILTYRDGSEIHIDGEPKRAFCDQSLQNKLFLHQKSVLKLRISGKEAETA